MGPQIVWVKGSPSEEMKEGGAIHPQVLQRLSIIAQMLLVSSTLSCFSPLTMSRFARRPSLHFSHSGTAWTGRAALILREL